ncbi:hypothetical protein RJT34_00272 [Clitoria ternatea]|uniref:PPC domain-containing protein n=1 Tax=Clitoria ternatea TaxID=43366 RepID=A0AAN9KFK9_CLITE
MANHNNNNISISLSHHSPNSESNSTSDYFSHHHHQPPQHQLDTTIPLSKKPRGRPPGSKNKPKPPVIITQPQQQASLISIVITIPPGNDIVESIISYARHRHVSVTILNVCGMVSNVTLRHELAPSAQALTLHGPFTIMSIFGSYIHTYHYASPLEALYSFSINVFGNQGQLLSGLVGGKVEALNEVTVLLGIFQNTEVYRAPPPNNNNNNNNNNNKNDNNNSKIDGASNLNNPSAYGNNNISRFNLISC